MVLSFVKPALSQTENQLPLKGLTIICDLDYTLFDYKSRGELKGIGQRNWLSEALHTFMNPHQIVTGMDQLLLTLQRQGSEIVFLSARPVSHLGGIKKFLNSTGFTNSEIRLSDTTETSAHFKYKNILQIAKSRPADKFILIGDNLDKDVEVFDSITVQGLLKGRVIAAFVRAVRRSVPVPKRYFEFNHGITIANILHQAGLLSAADLENIRVHSYKGAASICHNLFH